MGATGIDFIPEQGLLYLVRLLGSGNGGCKYLLGIPFEDQHRGTNQPLPQGCDIIGLASTGSSYLSAGGRLGTMHECCSVEEPRGAISTPEAKPRLLQSTYK